jgi:signal-transduction protein with cAMP-binding, CBS, and nucleotidyltransferase domain
MDLDTEPLRRIDSFPYRHRISELMTTPVATTTAETTIAAASQRMIREAIGSLVVVEDSGRAVGIVTERDVMRAMARFEAAAADLPIGRIMSTPVATVPRDAFAFVAFGRMPRLRVRHLLVVDDSQRPIGMVSAWALMRLRAGGALVIGDEIASAQSAAEIAPIWRRAADLVKALLGEGLHPLDVTAVVSAVLRDITARAAEIAERTMVNDGWGSAPAPWCVMVLGSGGRGEAALSADQDNAIIHEGLPRDDPWYAEAGRRMTMTLAEAGIPLCKGNVMASNAAWRKTAPEWQAAVEEWIRKADGADLLNMDIFIDLKPVLGPASLAERLRGHLLDRASKHPPFLHALALALQDMPVPLTLFGELVTIEGRLSIKKSGLMPLVNVVRLLAVKHRIAATATRERVQALEADGHLPPTDARRMLDIHTILAELLLRQQVRDAERGRPLTSDIDPNELDRGERKRLRDGLRHIRALKKVVETALSTM